MVNVLKSTQSVQEQFSYLKTLLSDSYKQIAVVEDRYERGKKYLLTRFKYDSLNESVTAEDIASSITKKTPTIPQIVKAYSSGKSFFLLQSYFPAREGTDSAVVIRSEYDLVALLNRILPTLSFLHSRQLCGPNKGPIEDVQSVVSAALGLMPGQHGKAIYDVQSDQWNGKLHLSKRRVDLLERINAGDITLSDTDDAILSEGNRIQTYAERSLKVLNTVESAHEKTLFPKNVLYLLAALSGLLIVVGVSSFLISRSKTEDPVLSPGKNAPAEFEAGCPTGKDVLPIGCDTIIYDADSTNFDGGSLKVSISEGGNANDRIFLQPQNVTIEENESGGTIVQEVFYKGVSVGVLKDQSGESTLEVVFNESSNAETVEAILRDVVYQNTSETTSEGTRQVEFALTDGDVGGASRTQTTTIGLYPSNSAPDVVVPAAQNGKEDTELFVSGIRVADVDIGDSFMTVTLSVKQGTIGINSSVASNRNVRPAQDRQSVELVGTLTEINRILTAEKAVIYTPAPDFSGSDTLSVTANDNGKSRNTDVVWDWPVNALDPRIASSTASISVQSINDAPEIILSRGTAASPTQRNAGSNVSPAVNSNTNASVAGNPSQRKNVRAGITTSDAVLFELSVGERVQIIGRANNQDGYLWYKIYSPTVGRDGWIAQHLINLD